MGPLSSPSSAAAESKIKAKQPWRCSPSRPAPSPHPSSSVRTAARTACASPPSPSPPPPSPRSRRRCPATTPPPRGTQTRTRPPLFLRPATHPVPASALAAFRRRAAALVPASAPHLHRHLRWLLADASTTSDSDPALFRAPLDHIESLWLGHVRARRPFQYVVGNEHWRDLVVAVKEGVLIPRPETEAVVDMVKGVEGFGGGWWADLGTGSGAIAVAVARELGDGGKVFATDVSDVAVEIARFNVERYGVQDKVEIRQGSWFEPLQDVKGKLMGVISNPPYIPTEDLPGLQPEVGWHEPKLALDGGRDGLEHLLHLCEGLSSALKSGGFFVFERDLTSNICASIWQTNGNKQSEFLVDLISSKWSSSFRDVKAVLDFADIKRFVTGYHR
ncbi:hypothetical protein PR202_gb24274 [Eleusine coracana subsp. coracana]|uniref:Methyltransferase small domain-containing protein n=1 Tax=Eleusine coracana subsp. coracana TaxID=191504 RepID=A0AAV5FMK3_ELECO|nr:hypothetical protein PR202_gb24274 [Eleusine coracana subsp. coracana]